jgi:hypothetical protein
MRFGFQKKKKKKKFKIPNSKFQISEKFIQDKYEPKKKKLAPKHRPYCPSSKALTAVPNPTISQYL